MFSQTNDDSLVSALSRWTFSFSEWKRNLAGQWNGCSQPRPWISTACADLCGPGACSRRPFCGMWALSSPARIRDVFAPSPLLQWRISWAGQAVGVKVGQGGAPWPSRGSSLHPHWPHLLSAVRPALDQNMMTLTTENKWCRREWKSPSVGMCKWHMPPESVCILHVCLMAVITSKDPDSSLPRTQSVLCFIVTSLLILQWLNVWYIFF